MSMDETSLFAVAPGEGGRVELSPGGVARRADTLRELQVALRRRTRRRRMARVAVGVVVPVLAVVAGAWVLASRQGLPEDSEPGARGKSGGVIADAGGHGAEELPDVGPSSVVSDPRVRGARFERVVTDPAIVPRLAVTGGVDMDGVLVDDEELLELLAEAGRPSGLVRTGRVVMLAPYAGGLGDGGMRR